MNASAQQRDQEFTPKMARGEGQSYQRLAHIINRLLNRIIEGLDDAKAAKFKPSVFQTIHSLHGLFNGQRVAEDKPLFKSHQFAAFHFDYKGKPENAGTFMARRLDDLRAAELACGRDLIWVRRADGVEQEMTSYEATPLLDAAEWLYLQARRRPDYWKNPAKAITEELLDLAIERLPEVEIKKSDAKLTDRGERAEMDAGDLMSDAVIKGQWTKIVNLFESNLARAVKAGGDPILEAEKVCKQMRNIARAMHAAKSEELQRARARIAAENEARAREEATGDEAAVSGIESARHFEPQEPVEETIIGEATPPQKCRGGAPEVPPAQQDNFSTPAESEPDMLAAALWWVRRGVPVFPLHSVLDDVCTCAEGSECKSKGKHPMTARGLKEATTDEAAIRRWWAKAPRANLGGATGGALRLLAVDVDPKHGGDASLYDLVEAHGGEWLDTFAQETGSLGNHFCLTYPEGVELRNSANKLGPGIDTRAEGGYVVLAPSLHASGRRYRLTNKGPFRPAPQWLIDDLTRKAGEQPANVINFQERRASLGGGVIAEGERNERLFKIGCAMYGAGEVSSAPELYGRLLEVNMERVSPTLEPSEVMKIAQSVFESAARHGWHRGTRSEVGA